MTKIAYDAAYPQPKGVAGTTVVLIYAGGDTPHVWTAAEIAEQPEQYRLPVYVRSDPSNDAASDAAAMLAWLRANEVPTGVATVLDLETAVDPAYVNAYAAALHEGGYLVLPYGSKSTLFKNPACDGYFVADPGANGVDPNTVATQYLYEGSWDLSFISDEVNLWNTQPPAPAPPAPPTPPPGDNVNLPTLSQSAGKSLWVESLQALLIDKFGQAGVKPVDGVFGPATEAGLIEVQKFFKLPETGKADGATWPVLLGL